MTPVHPPGGAGFRLGRLLDLMPAPSSWIARIFPSDERLIGLAGMEWSQAQFASLRWGLFCILSTLAFFVSNARAWDFMGIFLGLMFVAVGILAPGLWLRWRVDNRRVVIERALPDFIDRLVLGLEAGLGFEPVLRRTVTNFPGLLGREMTSLICKLDLGHTRSEALQDIAGRIPSARLAAFVTAVRQSDRLGTSLARVLRVQSELLRSYRRRQAQEASRRLPILIVFPLVFFLLPALLIVYLAPPLLHLLLGR